MSDDTCIICYEHLKTATCFPCPTCRIRLCQDCWLEKCKLYCPICQRRELNIPRTCSDCFESKHLQMITVCPICMDWVCNGCFSDTHHCNSIMKCVTSFSYRHLHDMDDIMYQYSKYQEIEYRKFRVLGMMYLKIGELVVLKDINKDAQDILIIYLDILDSPQMFKTIKDKARMRHLRMGTLNRGYKIYDPKNKHTPKHIQQFLDIVNNFRVCKFCRQDVTNGSVTSYCKGCSQLYHTFCHWRRSISHNKDA